MGQELVNQINTTYSVELLFEEVPIFDIDEITKDLFRNYGISNVVNNENKELVIFTFTEYQAEVQEGMVLNVQYILNRKYSKIDHEKIAPSLQQTWDFEKANETVRRAKYSCLLSDVFASQLDYRSRCELFNIVLLTILKHTNCIAVNWILSQKISDPKSFISRIEKGEYLNGALNVRLFKLEQANGEMVMDTVGLSGFGLPDIQCHFNNITASEIASLLYGYGNYIFENGDIFEDGDSVEGTRVNEKWICQHERSLIPPRRVVLNIIPQK
ncbi:DUF4261 domain-containing protein [Paenibacillus sp. MMS18-CY102]|uniref:DUF4261 domain-containing protein n=1 Tax=Paenibacillus sp. MMS18-CY102 TaxID=2682849 RepID=UPI001365A48B|nr:DUF4261 domain-containing protein [Paenibacillus sp. MMS18-CY102]MWC31263.1 DUF4261 domain-containing protein [Paenibacillus sp. MMS18-CY102]